MRKEFLFVYLDIRRISLAIAPGQSHRSEQPVGVVEFAALQVQKQGRVRFLKETEMAIDLFFF